MESRSARGKTAKGQQTRDRIVAEATRIFARDGYRSGSLQRIAEACGLTQQGLLHYFRSKADLLQAVVEVREEETAAHVQAAAAHEDEVDGFVDGVRHNAKTPHLVELMTVLSAESTSPDHPTNQWFTDRYDRLVARIAAGITLEQSAGRWASSADPVTAARLVVAIADGLRLQRLLGHPELDHAQVLADTVFWLRTGSPPE
ncbi:TetR/AcrR family transcriptional regulator [Ruania zhangjianzhongii]|uniref:TetR/AcrR family transcriptional regulator n=1 Tax=Ruania zhangjianzhongii TaxID=2603206 RepID=UPI0011CA6312|nr:TetR/AcrR family transcriptional regulator [Ruania zhangjianzhongii]